MKRCTPLAIVAAAAAALVPSTAAAQEAPATPPACTGKPALEWDTFASKRTRVAELDFARRADAIPRKPVKVFVKRRSARTIDWVRLNLEQYVYKRRKKETAEFTAVYVEDRSDYTSRVVQEAMTVPLPVPVTLPLLPILQGPPFNALPTMLLEVEIPGVTARGFEQDLCTRTLTTTVR